MQNEQLSATSVLDTPAIAATAAIPLLVGVGNSLVENGITEAIATAYARRTGVRLKSANLGRSGTSSRAIAINFGSEIIQYQPVGGIIPAGTTAVALTPNDPGPLDVFGGGGGTTEGLLANVPGVFEWVPGGPMTFKRNKAGAAVTVNAPAAYQPIVYDRNSRDVYSRGLTAFRDVVDNAYEGFAVLWSMANDVFDAPSPADLAAKAIAHYSGVIAKLSHPNAFVILSELNTRLETSSTRGHQQKLAINAALQARWPNNYVDVRTVLNAQGTAADKASDIPPVALLYDGYQHPNEAGRALIGDTVAAFLQSQGALLDLAQSRKPVQAAVRAYRSGTAFQSIAGIFATVEIDTVDFDTNFAFSPTAHTYTVPESGLYFLSAKMRASNTTAGISYGLGIGTTNADDASFVWTVTNGQREGVLNTRLAQLTRGDQIRVFAYSNVTIDLIAAELCAYRIG